MKRMIKMISCLLFFCPAISWAQLHLIINVTQSSANHAKDTLYIAGNFNAWNPADRNFVFSNDTAGKNVISLDLAPGIHEYKITRGSWSNVETTPEGGNISNRSVYLTKDSQVNIIIPAWADDFKHVAQPSKHTASAQVHIFDSAFAIPQLNSKRLIWVYLPQGYASSKKRYPVLYMHDGQNLFDEASAGFAEWGVDECLDSLFRQGVRPCIVIGINNTVDRMSEYNPYIFRNFTAKGDAYTDFIVNSLKPYVDDHLRTLKGKQHTFIAGSSMGGLISLYAVMKYPKVFGGAGIFSPAFWTAPALPEKLDRTGKKIIARLFFYAGAKESATMVSDMKKVEDSLAENSHAQLKEMIDAEAKHNEAAWRKYFPLFFKWLVND